MGYVYTSPWRRGSAGSSLNSSAFQVTKTAAPRRSSLAIPFEEPSAPRGRLSAPQRVDLSEGAMRAIAFGAELPGRVFETPFSLINVATGGGARKDQKGIIDSALEIPVLGDIFRGLGAALQWSGESANRINNAAYVQFLADHDDLDDDAEVMRPRGGLIGMLPGAQNDLLATALRGPVTMGALRGDAEARGITREDVVAVRTGRKSAWDFGDRPWTQDVAMQLASSVLLDPTNVLFFSGLGTPFKVASWAGRATGATRAVQSASRSIGRLPALQRAGLKLAKAPDAIAASRAMVAGNHAWATLKGLGHVVDQATRRIPLAGRPLAAYGRYVLDPRGYTSRRGVAGRLTVANVGLLGVQEVAGAADEADLPLVDGFMGGLRELSNDILNDRPLSQNAAWNFVAAFHYPVRQLAREAAAASRPIRAEAFGSDFRTAFARALTPVRKGGTLRRITGTDIDMAASVAELERRLGGKDRLDELIDYVADKVAFERMAPVIKAHYAAYDPVLHRFAGMHDAVHEARDAMLREGRITGDDLVRQFKDWFGDQGGFEGTRVRLEWDPDLAVEAWNTYRAAQAPIAKLLNDGLDVVVGRNELLTKENIDDVLRAVEQMADKNRMVSIQDVRRILLKVPQLVNLEAPDKTWWKSLGLPSAPDQIRLRDLRRRLLVAKKYAYSDADVFADVSDYERGAPLPPEDPRGTPGRAGWKQPRHLPGEATVAVSRMRPYIWRAPVSYEEVLFLRGKPVIQKAEANAGKVLRDSGFRVDSVQQQVGGWQGTLEPSVQINFYAGADLDELRLGAALTAKAWDQEASALWVTGRQRMREAGVQANGYVVQITGISQDQMHEAVRQTRALFGGEFEGFSLNDTAGTVTFLFPDEFGGVTPETLRRLKQIQQSIGRPARIEPPRRGYVEFISTEKGGGSGEQSAEGIIRRFGGDRRVQSFTAAVRGGAFGRSGRVRRLDGAGRRGARRLRGRGVGGGAAALEGSVLRLTDRASAERLIAALHSEGAVDTNEIIARWRSLDPDALPEAEIEGDMVRLADAGYDVSDVRRHLDQFQETGNLAFWRQSLNDLGFLRNSNDPAVQLFDKYADLEPLSKRKLATFTRELDDLERQGYDVDAVRAAVDEFADARPKSEAWYEAWERVTEDLFGIPEKPQGSSFSADLDGDELQAELLNYGRSHINELARGLGYTDIEEVVPTRGIVRYGLDDTEAMDLIDELKATLGPDGQPLPDRQVDYEVLNERLEGAIRAERDQMSGIKPGDEIGRVLYDRERDMGQLVRPVRLHQSLSEMLPDDRAMLAEWERWLRDQGLGYTLKKAPGASTMLRDDDGMMAAALRQRTAMGHWLFDFGPLSRMTGFLKWLTQPVRNSDTGRAARQALYNELLPHHASVEQVDRFVEALKQESGGHSFKLPGGPRIHLFRGPNALLPSHINTIAAGRAAKGGEHLPPEAGIFSAKTVEEIGADNFFRILDRASNRFVRSVEYRPRGQRAGAPLRALTAVYDFWGASRPGVAGRIVSRTFYPLFRFTVDPRWLFLNALEADILGSTRDGLRATAMFGGAATIEPSTATKTHALQHPIDALDDTWLESSFLWNRNLAGHVTRSFDHRRPETTIEVLNELGKNHPLIREMKERFGTDDQRELAEALDEMLYFWDTKGTKQTLEDALLEETAKGTLKAQDIEAMRPLLDELWRRHEDLYVSIVKLYRGSADRSNLERILNSYWLYWPVSYQIKATKWLYDILTEGAFGRQTNLGGAAWLNEQRKRHERRLVQDATYRETFRSLPTGWFVAQMLLPVTPFDLGVSLNRAVRYVGGMVGLWEPDKRADNLGRMAAALATMGPVYTAELLERLGRDIAEGEDEEELELELPSAPVPILPTTAPVAPPA